MKDKTKQVWCLYANDKKGLEIACVDIVSKGYLELGQKPTPETIALMGTLLADDLAHNYARLELDEVQFAFSKGIRNGEQGTSCFINVRTWNVWLKDYKKSAMLQRQKNQVTEFQNYKLQQKQISHTINQVKKLK